MGALLKKQQVSALPEPPRPLHTAAPVASSSAPVPETIGAAVVSDDLDRYRQLFERVVRETVAYRERALQELQPPLLELTLALVRAIIGRETTLDPTLIEYTLTQSLKHLHLASRLVVRLHATDLAHVRARPELLEGVQAQVELVADERIERGGCLIESDRGGLDVTLATQLQCLAEALGRGEM